MEEETRRIFLQRDVNGSITSYLFIGHVDLFFYEKIEIVWYLFRNA